MCLSSGDRSRVVQTDGVEIRDRLTRGGLVPLGMKTDLLLNKKLELNFRPLASPLSQATVGKFLGEKGLREFGDPGGKYSRQN